MNVLLIDAQPLFLEALEGLTKSIFPDVNVYKESCAAKASNERESPPYLKPLQPQIWFLLPNIPRRHKQAQ